MRPIKSTLYGDVERMLSRSYKDQEELRRLNKQFEGVYSVRLENEVKRAAKLERWASDLYEIYSAQLLVFVSFGDFWTFQETGQPRALFMWGWVTR